MSIASLSSVSAAVPSLPTPAVPSVTAQPLRAAAPSPTRSAERFANLELPLKSVLQANALSTAGGVQALVDILNHADRTTEKLILDGLSLTDPDLADEVRSRMFVFRDIVGLDDRTIQLVLRGVDSKELAMALKGVAPEVREKITKNMSEPGRAQPARGDRHARPGPHEVGRKRAGRRRGHHPRTGGVRELVLSRRGDEFVG